LSYDEIHSITPPYDKTYCGTRLQRIPLAGASFLERRFGVTLYAFPHDRVVPPLPNQNGTHIITTIPAI
jgi:hypothetical protein